MNYIFGIICILISPVILLVYALMVTIALCWRTLRRKVTRLLRVRKASKLLTGHNP